MKWLRLLIFNFTIFCLPLEAADTGTLLLRAVILPKFSLSFDHTREEGNRSVISLVAKSNTYQFENHHRVEVENPLGLDLKTEEFEIDGKSSQKEYRITLGKNTKISAKNLFFTVKISAN